MPRVKLKRFRVKRPSPDALARYLREYPGYDLYHHPDEQTPITAEALFDRDPAPDDPPLVFDLGCGRGEFIVEQAAQHLDVLFVGFDWHEKSVWDAVNRAERAGVDNVRIVKADVRLALRIVPDATVREVFMLFPPPASAERRRKTDPLPEQTLREIHRVLEPGGPFHFVTDHAGYFAIKRTMIEESGLFELAQVGQQIEGGLTRFQQFWESREIESKRLEARKRPAASD